ncbi:MAG: ATP phosphoribosyltransferase [Phenylobacterium sp.]|nr:ATP phosphoribosyltransferase [Phenylobacterium sp.]
MSDAVTLAIPSKGRLKEQVETWLQDCGLGLSMSGGDRGYRARLQGVDGVQVRLLSAGDIAAALVSGEVHLGVTGEDLLREQGAEAAASALLLRPLGFGRADLVVAAPRSWLDVSTMADLEEVAHERLVRTGRRLRVATKYLVQTREFFARHGVADYRIVESGGATEGAPAAGAADVVVDITTTGATLRANDLKILEDGVILRSEAQLTAGLRADWTPEGMAAAESLLRILEARAAAHASATLIWPGGDKDPILPELETLGAVRRPNGLLAPVGLVARVAARLTAAGRGPVTASRPDFVFETACPPIARLRTALGQS